MYRKLTQKKLSYYRGSLIALRWDQQLKAKGSSLKKMIAYLFEKSKASNGELTDSDLYEFGEKYGLNFKQDIDRYIIEGQEIDLLTDAFSGYQLQKDKIRLFYPGYDVTQSGREKVIQGVDINGPAYKAGLRDGMEYVRRKNSNRWSNSWSAKEPFTVFVKVDGTEKQIDFFPEGEEKLVYLYGKADWLSFSNKTTYNTG